ncbi:MAG: type II toxin-antitoxin system ParD family antitoxin [Kiloniellales bacterium]
MARNTSNLLGNHFAAFIETKVRFGRDGSASDVVLTGLLLEEHEAWVKVLHETLIAGAESGASTLYSIALIPQQE